MVVLSVITVNYNGLKDTCALIDTIPIDQEVEVIVVDNGSKTDEASAIRLRYPHVKAFRSDQNLGFAGGNNLGIRHATGQYLYLVNNDTFFAPFNVAPLIQRLKSSPTVGMVCPKIRFSWSPQPIQFAGYTPLSKITLRNKAIGFNEADHGQYDTPHTTPYAHGAAMMLKREVIEKAGLLPECFFLYYEELDWSMTITRAGYEIWYEPAATIFHKESQSTGQDSPLKVFYITRNRLLLAQRNMTGLSKLTAQAYLVAIVALRDYMKYVLKGKHAHRKAVVQGIREFFQLKSKQ